MTTPNSPLDPGTQVARFNSALAKALHYLDLACAETEKARKLSGQTWREGEPFSVGFEIFNAEEKLKMVAQTLNSLRN
jgi:hypothetical protein